MSNILWAHFDKSIPIGRFIKNEVNYYCCAECLVEPTCDKESCVLSCIEKYLENESKKREGQVR